MFKKELDQNKVLFDSQQHQTANGQIVTTGFPTLSALRRQISGLLLAAGSIENQTDSNSSLLPHLARFVAHFLTVLISFSWKARFLTWP